MSTPPSLKVLVNWLEIVAHNFVYIRNQKLGTIGVFVVDILQESRRIALFFADMHN